MGGGTELQSRYLALANGIGNDTIYGFGGDDTFTVGKGNDRMEDTGGSDSYAYAKGDGSDWIRDGGAATDIDRLMLGAGITEAEVKLTRDTGDTEDLKLSFTVSGGSVVLDNQFWTNVWGMERIEFASGAVWAAAELQTRYLASAATVGNDTILGFSSNDVITGGAGADKLDALAGADTLIGGIGNDTVNGGAGNDTYIFARGDGQDIVTDSDTAANTDCLIFGAGIATDQLWFSHVGANLLINVLGNNTNDRITVTNWYGGAANQIERLETTDGHWLDHS